MAIDKSKWRILVADDNEAIRQVTRFILEGIELEGHSLELIDVDSGAKAKAILENEPDIASPNNRERRCEPAHGV